MNICKVAKLLAQERFLYWIKERHAIYLRRKAGKPKPWTDDKVLQSYFFTNPYRENDKTTVWFRNCIREPMRDNPEVLMATVIFRWFNRIITGEMLLEKGLLRKWHSKRAIRLLEQLHKEGPIFTGAYVVNARHGSRNAPPRTKIDVCCERIARIWQDKKLLVADIENSDSLQLAHRLLRKYQGLDGTGFAAYEIISDLRYTYLLEESTDKYTWCNPGPGARRGLNRVLNRKLETPIIDWKKQSVKLLEIVRRKLRSIPIFEMREVEHSLCEFDKYERARLQQGHLKRRYKS